MSAALFGPRESKRIALKAIEIRENTGAYWGDIADQLGVPVGWLRDHTMKHGREKQRQGRRSQVATPDNLKRAATLRAAGKSWKVIAREMGLDHWNWLRTKVNTADALQVDDAAELDKCRAAWARDVPFADFWAGWIARARQ